MKIIPNAKPPNTKCQCQGIENIGLVSEPMILNKVAVAAIPIITPAIMRQEAMRVNKISAPPINNASVETSPIEPGRLPINASIQVIG